MKKIWKIFAAAFFVLFTSVSFSSCDLLSAFLGDMLADAFEGEPNEWLEITVKYDEGGLVCGDVNLAFFYTEVEREGHTSNNTRLAYGTKIKPGLTIVCYGRFRASKILQFPVCYTQNISIEDGAKFIWGTLFNLSSQLRDLSKNGQVITGGDIVNGEKYGKWNTFHVNDGVELLPGQERVPEPLSNAGYGNYFTNDDLKEDPGTKDYSVDWDAALGKIGLSTRVVTRR